MPESGQMQSKQSSIITTPIESRQSSISPRNNVQHERVEIEGKRAFPEPKNLEEYHMAFNKPYTFEYFNFGEDLQAIETYAERATAIDDFIKSEIDEWSMEDNLDSYKSIIAEILITLDIHPQTSNVVKMEKLYNWVKNVLIPNREQTRRRKQYG